MTIRNQGTNFTRTAITDSAGRYAVPDMPLGPYEVQAQASGWEPAAQQVFVTLGSSVSAVFRLSMTAETESVSVRAQDPGIEPTRTAPKSILTELQLKELPSNGRRIQNNVLDTPATLIEPECRGFSVSGQKGIFAMSILMEPTTTAPGGAAFADARNPRRPSVWRRFRSRAGGPQYAFRRVRPLHWRRDQHVDKIRHESISRVWVSTCCAMAAWLGRRLSGGLPFPASSKSGGFHRRADREGQDVLLRPARNSVMEASRSRYFTPFWTARI